MHAQIYQEKELGESRKLEKSGDDGGNLIILVLRSVLQDACKLNVVKIALLVNWGFSEQLVHLLVCESVSHCGQQLSQIFFWYMTCRQTEQTIIKTFEVRLLPA